MCIGGIYMKKCTIKKLNNDGSAFVVAVVSVAFISILATLLLYSANMNYQMKGTDYNTKQVFYGAEKPLEEIRACLSWDVSNAAKVAYENTLLEYGANNGDTRANVFFTEFVSAYEDIWDDRNSYVDAGVTKTSWGLGTGKAIEAVAGSAALDDYHILENNASVWDETKLKCKSTTCNKPYHIILDSVVGDRLSLKTQPGTSKKYLTLENVRVIYTNKEYSSIISTDFCISCPTIDWQVQQTLDNTDAVSERGIVNFETFVTYMDWEKQ